MGIKVTLNQKFLEENFLQENKYKKFTFYYPRLPILVTDQNQSFFKLDPVSNIPILLEHLRNIKLD